MPIVKNGSGEIVYTPTAQPWNGTTTGVHADNEFAIADKNNPTKQIQFNVVPTTGAAGVLTVQADIGADATINLTDISARTAFTTIQPDAGTSPVADSATDTLTLTSSGGSILITGDSATDTINFALNTTVPTATATGSTYSCTPNSGAFGTISGAVYKSFRHGDRLVLRGYFVTGTLVGGASTYITLPNGITIDSAKCLGSTAIEAIGTWRRISSAASANTWDSSFAGDVFWDGSDTGKIWFSRSTASGVLTKQTPTQMFASGDGCMFTFDIPVTGWTVSN